MKHSLRLLALSLLLACTTVGTLVTALPYGLSFPSRGNAALDVAQDVDDAWEYALRLAKVDPEKAANMVRPEVVWHRENHYLGPNIGYRLCGQITVLWTKNPDGNFTMHMVAHIYGSGRLNTMVHEFLHYILGWEDGQFASEEAVRTVFPALCEAE